jgi:hypothetical protein
VALEVALDTRAAEELTPGTFAVHVSVSGGQRPLQLSAYFDGQLVGAWDSVADVYEFRASDLFGARHALTVRAVDAAGQWGGASTVIRAVEPGRGADDSPPTPAASQTEGSRPRLTLRSSVRSRRRA